MTEVNGGALVARQLAQDGLDTFFGVLAGPMLQVFEAAPAAGLQVIGTRHEEQAGFMAQAWGFMTGRPGVIVTGSGPGTANSLPSLLVAKENGWPMIALGGSVASRERSLGGFQESDQLAYMARVSRWYAQVDAVDRIPELIHLAAGKAIAGRPGPCYLDFPAELLWSTADDDVLRATAQAPRVFAAAPDPAAVEEIASMLAQAERPVVLLGKGVNWSPDLQGFTALADAGIPFLPAPMARGVVPDTHPMNGAATRSHVLENADAVLMLGGRFNWMVPTYHRSRGLFSPRIAQVDIDPAELHSGANVEIGVVADAGAAATAIAAALDARPLRCAAWADDVRQRVAGRRDALEGRLEAEGDRMTNMLLWREIRAAITPDTIVATDGEITPAVGRMVLDASQPKTRLDAGTTSCMGTGLPYAIGAKIARPDQPVMAVLGDWAFGASAPEVETAARVGAPVVIIVSNNGGIAGHHVQDALFPDGGPPIASLLRADYHEMARMVGGYGEQVTVPDEIGPAIERAVDAGTVALLNVMTEPDDFPLRRGADYLTSGYSFSAKSSSGY